MRALAMLVLMMAAAPAHALISIVAWSSVGGSYAASQAVNLGRPLSGIGDLMVAIVTVANGQDVSAQSVGGSAWTTLSGWPRSMSGTESSFRQYIFYRTVTASDIAQSQYTFTPQAGGCMSVVTLTLRGVDTGNPIAASNSLSTNLLLDLNYDADFDTYFVRVPWVTVSPSMAGAFILSAVSTNYWDATARAPIGSPPTRVQFSWQSGFGNLCNNQGSGLFSGTTIWAGASHTASGATGDLSVQINLNSPYGLSDGTHGFMHSLVAFRPATVPNPVSRWRFEESTGWSGAANEIVDDHGANHLSAGCDSAIKAGCASSTPRPPVGLPFQSSTNAFGGSGRSALLNPSAYSIGAGVDAAVLAINAWQHLSRAAPNTNLNITDDMTVSMFVCKFQNATHRLALYSHGTRVRFGMEPAFLSARWTDSTGTARSAIASAGAVPVNTWTHVAWVFRRGHQALYVNGFAQHSSTESNALQSGNPALFLGYDPADTFSSGTLPSGVMMRRQFRGMLDDVRVYNGALSEADLRAMATGNGGSCGMSGHSAPAGVVLSGFTITPSGGAASSTCAAKGLTVTANTSSGTYTGTVRLTGPSGATWALASGAGVLTVNPGGLGNHIADYTYAAGDANSAQFSMSYATPADVSVSAVDNPATVSSAATTLNFRAGGTNSFVITNPGGELAPSAGVAGRAHTLTITMSASCAAAATYSGTRNVQLWRVRDGADPNGAAPTVGGTAVPTSASTSFPLSFTNGVAQITLASTDVGKFTLNAQDASGTWAASTVTTSSAAAMTLRPFGFSIESVQWLNPVSGLWVASSAGGGSGDAMFAPAGATFNLTARAKLWQAADDVNNDGVPDAGANLQNNSDAPSFASATSLAVGTSWPTPGGGAVAGSLGGTTTIGAGAFASGQAAITLSYSEVGSFTLVASVANYLGTGGASASGTHVIGRFYPHAFTVSWNTPSFAPACGGLTFAGQSFGYGTAPTATITAVNTAGATTVNYGIAGWYKLPATISATFNASGTPAASAFNPPAGHDVATLSNAGNGTITALLSNGSFSYTRAATTFAPFTPSFQISGFTVTDSEGRTSGATASSSFGFAGNAQVRYGRLFVTPALSSYAPTANATVNFTVRHANDGTGASWTTAADAAGGGCLPAIGMNNVATVFGGATLAACDSALNGAASAWASGQSSVTLLAPGAGENGTVVARLNLGVTGGNYCLAKGGAQAGTAALAFAHLRGGLDADTGVNGDPAGTVTFSASALSARRVVVREVY